VRSLPVVVCLCFFVAAGACDQGASFDVPEPTERSDSPAQAPRAPDRVASCDQAKDGTPCGEADRVMHCLFNACVRNACGDGILAGSEECDDGDEADADGCSARCTLEACGNGIKDPGEECDDGNDNEQDRCVTCRNAQAAGPSAEPGLDSGLTSSAGVGCPTMVQLSADPANPGLGGQTVVTGPSLAGGVYLWSAVDETNTSAGMFQQPTSASTGYTCPMSKAEISARLLVSKVGCLPILIKIAVYCGVAPDAGSEPEPSTDGGGMDASTTDDAGVDAGTDAGSDAGSQPRPDAGQREGGLPEACLACVREQCVDYPLTSGINWVATCFLNDPNNQFDPSGNPEVQPRFSELCTAAVNCSLAARSGCADDTVGPARCYCGEQSITQCLSSGPTAGAECVGEWERAAECPTGDYSCTAGANFSDFSRPSGHATTIIECANANCATQCALTP
jgi:cysteine-rich repeat protein